MHLFLCIITELLYHGLSKIVDNSIFWCIQTPAVNTKITVFGRNGPVLLGIWICLFSLNGRRPMSSEKSWVILIIQLACHAAMFVVPTLRILPTITMAPKSPAAREVLVHVMGRTAPAFANK